MHNAKSNENLMLDLAKLVIAAAWADGELSGDEVNALKDILFSIEDVTAHDWSILSMYMESPPSDDEKAELLHRVLLGIRSSQDKALAIETLEKLFRCDGKFTSGEEELLEKLKEDISNVATGLFPSLANAFKSAINRRDERVRSSCLREQKWEDYVRNTIYYDLTQRQEASSVTLDKSETEVRKLCLATGLLSHVANVDEGISPEERDTMKSILVEDWGLAEEQAELFVSIGCDRTTRGLDYFRLSHGYFECTTIEERREFLKTLFRIANTTDRTSNDEIEAIRRVAKSLKLSHKDFIDAKLTVPRADRNGL